MTTLSTHVLDTALGAPRAGVAVRLESGAGTVIASAVTDVDGRVRELAEVGPGTVRLVFELHGDFFPEAVVTFTVTGEEHLHVPLLAAPYGWSTYRGS